MRLVTVLGIDDLVRDGHHGVLRKLLRDEPEGQGTVGLVQVVQIAGLSESGSGIAALVSEIPFFREINLVGLLESLGIGRLSASETSPHGDGLGRVITSLVIDIPIGLLSRRKNAVSAVFKARNHYLGDISLGVEVGVIEEVGELDAGQGMMEEDGNRLRLIDKGLVFAFVHQSRREKKVLLSRSALQAGTVIVKGDGTVGRVVRQVLDSHTLLIIRGAKEEVERKLALHVIAILSFPNVGPRTLEYAIVEGSSLKATAICPERSSLEIPIQVGEVLRISRGALRHRVKGLVRDVTQTGDGLLQEQLVTGTVVTERDGNTRDGRIHIRRPRVRIGQTEHNLTFLRDIGSVVKLIDPASRQ